MYFALKKQKQKTWQYFLFVVFRHSTRLRANIPTATNLMVITLFQYFNNKLIKDYCNKTNFKTVSNRTKCNRSV